MTFWTFVGYVIGASIVIPLAFWLVMIIIAAISLVFTLISERDGRV